VKQKPFRFVALLLALSAPAAAALPPGHLPKPGYLGAPQSPPPVHRPFAYERPRARPRPVIGPRDPRAMIRKARVARFVGEQIDISDVQAQLRALTGLAPLRSGAIVRDRASFENRVLVRHHLQETLEALGYEVRIEAGGKFGNPLKPGVPAIEQEVVNLVAEARGTAEPEKILEVSAHYDTFLEGVPGADDNGSGVVTVLEIARLLRQMKPAKTVRFVLTDLEERGKDGSYLHAENIRSRGERIEGAVVIDMIGYAPAGESEVPYVIEVGTERHHREAESYEGAWAIGNEFAHQVRLFGDRKARPLIETHKALPGTGDHGPYWNLGIPAVLIAAVYGGHYVNPGYHKPTDTMDGVNWDHFPEVLAHITEGVARMSGVSIPERLRGEFALAEAQRYSAAERADHRHEADFVTEAEESPAPSLPGLSGSKW
jgi:hypothetical protein